MDRKLLLRKGLAVGIILLFVGTGIIPSTGQKIEKSSTMTSRGNWLYVGGSGPGNYTKIQDAIDNASEGDTVFVYDDSSPYYENVDIKNVSISLIGEDKNTTVIDGGGIFIDVDNVKIAGFMIINGYCGIAITSHFNIITGNNICFNYDCGICSEDGTSNVIIGNTLFENGNFGIFLEDVSKIDIIDNVIFSNHYGIFIDYSNDINLIDNVIFSNNYTGAGFFNLKNCTITGNIISDNGNGQNSFGVGMILEYSTNILIRRNTFQNNFEGLFVPFGNTRIEENNFIGNTINAQTTIFNRETVWLANYWDNWIGLKFHGPICQRFPKIILSVILPGVPFLSFVDWHPAKEPYDIREMR